MIYALADCGVRLLKEWDRAEFRDPECRRKNREAGRPFIEHQIAIVDFQVALRRVTRECSDIRLVMAEELTAAAPRPLPGLHPFSLHARLTDCGTARDASVIPDLVFALKLAGGARRDYMVEIDRGTMPVTRSDPDQTSIERKMRVYLAAHAAEQHQRQFGWKDFRVLVVTTDRQRIGSMIDALVGLRMPRGAAPSLFLFTTFGALAGATPLDAQWLDGTRRPVDLT